MSDQPALKTILEGALLTAGEPLPLSRLAALFGELQPPSNEALRDALQTLEAEYAQEDKGVMLKRVAGGYRFQAKPELAPWIQRLSEDRPPRYSRALLETLSLVIYRQPITRGEIEDVRGVAVSTNIMKTLQERGWVKVLGYKEVPGKPALFGTTKALLDYFNVKSLSEFPPLQEVADLAEAEQKLQKELSLNGVSLIEEESNEEVSAERQDTEQDEQDEQDTLAGETGGNNEQETQDDSVLQNDSFDAYVESHIETTIRSEDDESLEEDDATLVNED